MAEYASLDYDLNPAGSRLALAVDRASGELSSFRLDNSATPSGTVEIVASGVERGSILALPDGAWVAVYNIGTALYARVTRDGGESWGAQETLPLTLRAVAPQDGSYRFVIAYLPQFRLFALVFTRLVSGTSKTFITALRRDEAGGWTQGAETDLGASFTSTLPARAFLLPLADGRLMVREGWFADNFSWDTPATVAYQITNNSGPGLFGTPRYLTCVRAAELPGGVILCVGTQLNRAISDLIATGGWASAVMWRTGAEAWNGLRDSGAGVPPLSGTALNNYIGLAPATSYATGGETANGYCGACGQMRRLRDGSAELLYHDRDGSLKLKRNRMTLYSYYPSSAMPDFSTYQLTYWTTSRRDTWE